MKLFRDSLMALLILTGSASCASVTTARPKASLIGSGVFVSDSGQTIRADYRDNGTVTLIFTDGTTKVLSQAVSASGARYVSGSYEWWEHQGEATYSVNEKQMFVGKLKPSLVPNNSFKPTLLVTSAACLRYARTRSGASVCI